eukprot:m.368408 g.368408  ORF g.368408 m.368408 type:complete len:442 (-) comp19977_c1_seq9:49-1374(-)
MSLAHGKLRLRTANMARLRERCDGDVRGEYHAQAAGDGVILTQSTVHNARRWWSLRSFLVEAFLPQGFPDSVCEDYVRYQVWDTLQAFCSSITGQLATHAVLKGVGVGNEAATATAAAMTWMLRDGTGMVGRIAFAWYNGTDLDNNSKQWRLVADVLNDVAIFVELLSPAFPSYFVLLVCFSSLARAIVGVAGGATRAALTQHQARANNTGDVSAKDGSQETVVNLCALLTGLVVTPLVAGNQVFTWMLFLVFTFLHLFCNYCAVRALQFDEFNSRRAEIVINHYLASGFVLTPAEANRREPLFAWTWHQGGVTLGATLAAAANTSLQHTMTRLLKGDFAVTVAGRSVLVFLSTKFDDIRGPLPAFFEAQIVKHVLSHPRASSGPLLQYADVASNDSVLRTAEQLARTHYAPFAEQANLAGWRTDKTMLGCRGWRYELMAN